MNTNLLNVDDIQPLQTRKKSVTNSPLVVPADFLLTYKLALSL